MSALQSVSRLQRIVVAYSVNRAGTWVGLVALMVAVFDHTHSALAVAALLFVGQALPAFVVPVVVARVETSSRGRELSGLYVLEAVVTGGLAVLMWHFSLPAVLVLVAVDGTAAMAAMALLRGEAARAAREEMRVSAERGLATGVVAGGDQSEADEAELKANAALNVAFAVTFVLGPVIGGLLAAAIGAPGALLIDVGSFLVCGGLLIELHPHVEEAGGDGVRARLEAAWRHINDVPSLRALLMTDAVAILFFEAAGPIEVTYAKETLHAGDHGLGLLLSAWGAGTVVGSLAFARMRRPLGGMLSAGALAIGVAYLGFAAAPSLALACVAAVVGGIGNGTELPALTSIVQRLTPPNLQGRLMAAMESLTALSLAVGLPLGGALVALSSPRAAFIAIGIAVIAASAVLLSLARRAPRLAEPPEAPTAAASDAAGAVRDTRTGEL